jgi:threonine aldolase
MIDLRSDTVTKPSPGMLRAMMNAQVGDDVYGEDPTVNRLQEMIANVFGMEAAIFAPSGTQTNLMALMSHCERGDEYIVGQQAHTYKYEAGGAAVLGSVQPQPLDYEVDGTLSLQKIKAAIKPPDDHFARTKLLCFENTYHGLAVPLTYYKEAKNLADSNGLKTHLDGARIFNAAVLDRYQVNEVSPYFDSVSVCLSKGLGAPVGSLLVGSRDLITRAHRWRKMLGGGMRQAGILAAAGIYALENNISRLAEDHEMAAKLAKGLSRIEELKVDYPSNQTNMVFAQIGPETVQSLVHFMLQKGILLYPGTNLRLVTHLDLRPEDIQIVIRAFSDFFHSSDYKG